MNKITSPKVVEHYIKSHENDTSDKTYPNLMLVRSFNFLMENTGRKVLDYGCGYGCNTIFMLSKNVDVCYSDTSPYAVEKTANKIKKIDNIEALHFSKTINIDAQELPFDNEEFDVIVCTSVLSLLSNEETILSLLEEFSRILKPGGKIYTDINGIESEFVFYSEDLGNNQYKYYGKDKKANPLIAYCPKSIKDFSNIINSYFDVLYLGSSQHSLFDFKEHEYIAIGQKK